MIELNEKEDKYRKDIIRMMKSVGTYNKSFEYPINVLAKVMADYETISAQFITTGAHIVIPHTNKNGSRNVIKNPLYLALEKLRDDVINYTRELGLTPSGLKRINQDGAAPPKKTKLEMILTEIKNEKD